LYEPEAKNCQKREWFSAFLTLFSFPGSCFSRKIMGEDQNLRRSNARRRSKKLRRAEELAPKKWEE